MPSRTMPGLQGDDVEPPVPIERAVDGARRTAWVGEVGCVADCRAADPGEIGQS